MTDRTDPHQELLTAINDLCAGRPVEHVLSAVGTLMGIAVCRNRNTVVEALKLAEGLSEVIRQDIRKNFGRYRYPS